MLVYQYFTVFVLFVEVGAKMQYFPITEFYNISYANVNLYIDITEKHLCESGFLFNKKCCSCDATCVKYRTCCIDYWWNNGEWETLNDYILHVKKVNEKLGYTSCLPVIEASNKKDTVEHLMMVRSCPYKTSPRSTEIQPVIAKDGIVYMNPTVAECQEASGVLFMDIKMECSKGTDLSTFENCRYTVAKNDGKTVERCFPIPKFQPCTDDSRDRELCADFQGFVVDRTRQRYYSNIHCLRSCEEEKDFHVQTCSVVRSIQKPMRYSVIVSFNKLPAVVVRDERNGQRFEINCPPGQRYSMAQKACTKVICRQGQKLSENGGCVKQEEKKSNFTASIVDGDSLYDKLKKCLLTKSAAHAVFPLDNSFKHDLRNLIANYRVIYENRSTFAVKEIMSSRDFETVIHATSRLSSASVVSEKPVSTGLYGLDVRRNFPGSLQCYKPRELNLHSIDVHRNCSITSISNFKKDDYIINFNNGKPSVVVCDVYHLKDNCPLIKHHNASYFANGTVLFGSTGQRFPPQQYLPLEDGVAVCLRSPSQRSWLETALRAEEYVTLIATLISAVCYCLIIHTYLKFNELWTIPGLNLVFLCAMLLMSDLLILLSSAARASLTTCQALAVTLHWSLLSVQAWTLVISVEICLTFRRNAGNSTSIRRFLKYCCFAVGLPLVIVITANILDAVKVLNLGYGTSRLCWIRSFNGRVYLYLTPMIFVFFANTCVLAWVLIRVYKQHKISKKVLHQTTPNTSIVCTALKLIVLLGVIEVVGFVQLPSKYPIVNVVFRFLFTIFRGLRGLFIWILYVYMNSRVWFLFQRGCGKAPSDGRESPNLTRLTRISPVTSRKGSSTDV